MSKINDNTREWIHDNCVDEGFLSDWYQSSVNEDDDPSWSDAHISEVTGDFYLIPKEAVDGKNGGK